MLAIDRDKITIYTNNQVEEISIREQEEDSRVTMLRETCTALRERRKAETDYGDNLKTFTWMQCAVRASEKQEWIDLAADGEGRQMI